MVSSFLHQHKQIHLLYDNMNIRILHILVFLFSIFSYTPVIPYTNAYKMISPSQWSDLQHIILSPETTPSMRQKVNFIVFQRHLPMMYRIVTHFRSVHRKKSNNIKHDDMLAYAYKGLYDASCKYNGRFAFVKYANIYIQGALYKALTEHHPISIQTKSQRRTRANYSTEYYQTIRNNIYLQKRDYLSSFVSETRSISIEPFVEKWKHIQTFPPFVNRCFSLKFDFYFNRIRTNQQVSDLMCCKEEWVRRNIAYYTHILLQNYSQILPE